MPNDRGLLDVLDAVEAFYGKPIAKVARRCRKYDVGDDASFAKDMKSEALWEFVAARDIKGPELSQLPPRDLGTLRPLISTSKAGLWRKNPSENGAEENLLRTALLYCPEVVWSRRSFWPVRSEALTYAGNVDCGEFDLQDLFPETQIQPDWHWACSEIIELAELADALRAGTLHVVPPESFGVGARGVRSDRVLGVRYSPLVWELVATLLAEQGEFAAAVKYATERERFHHQYTDSELELLLHDAGSDIIEALIDELDTIGCSNGAVDPILVPALFRLVRMIEGTVQEPRVPGRGETQVLHELLRLRVPAGRIPLRDSAKLREAGEFEAFRDTLREVLVQSVQADATPEEGRRWVRERMRQASRDVEAALSRRRRVAETALIAGVAEFAGGLVTSAVEPCFAMAGITLTFAGLAEWRELRQRGKRELRGHYMELSRPSGGA